MIVSVFFYALAAGAGAGCAVSLHQGNGATAWQLAKVMVVAAALILVTAVVRRVRGAR